MPFVLPEYDSAFTRFFSDAVFELARARSPLLSQIPFETSPGTGGSRIRDREGMNVDLPPTSTEFEFLTSLSAIRAGDVAEFVTGLDAASEQLAEQLVRVLLSTVDKVVEGTGNVVDAGGSLTFESFYEMLDKIAWSLDDQGELSLPTLVLHPDTARKLPVLTQAQQEMIEALKQRKREELLARRRRRRLH